MTEIVGTLLIAAAGLFAIVVLALAIVAVLLCIEVHRLGRHNADQGKYVAELEDSRERWIRAFYAQRDHFYQQGDAAEQAESAAWWAEIDSYANEAGEGRG